ncbi:unnamed protein product, partial [Lampetra fluviatilis]
PATVIVFITTVVVVCLSGLCVCLCVCSACLSAWLVAFQPADRPVEEGGGIAGDAPLVETTEPGARPPGPTSPPPTRGEERPTTATGAVAARGVAEAPGSTPSPVPGEGEE